VSGIGLGTGKALGLHIGLGLGLGSGLIFRFSSKTAYLIYRFLVDGTEWVQISPGKKIAQWLQV